jgi:hypothetical protein
MCSSTSAHGMAIIYGLTFTASNGDLRAVVNRKTHCNSKVVHNRSTISIQKRDPRAHTHTHNCPVFYRPFCYRGMYISTTQLICKKRKTASCKTGELDRTGKISITTTLNTLSMFNRVRGFDKKTRTSCSPCWNSLAANRSRYVDAQTNWL